MKSPRCWTGYDRAVAAVDRIVVGRPEGNVTVAVAVELSGTVTLAPPVCPVLLSLTLRKPIFATGVTLLTDAGPAFSLTFTLSWGSTTAPSEQNVLDFFTAFQPTRVVGLLTGWAMAGAHAATTEDGDKRVRVLTSRAAHDLAVVGASVDDNLPVLSELQFDLQEAFFKAFNGATGMDASIISSSTAFVTVGVEHVGAVYKWTLVTGTTETTEVSSGVVGASLIGLSASAKYTATSSLDVGCFGLAPTCGAAERMERARGAACALSLAEVAQQNAAQTELSGRSGGVPPPIVLPAPAPAPTGP